MEVAKSNWKKTLFSKWRRIKNPNFDFQKKARKKCQVAPEGCFTVYVGEERQRFAVKTEFANHELFKILLEDAEMEYGYNSDGPILLNCDVGLFYKVLAEMDCNDEIRVSKSFSFGDVLCSPARCYSNNNGLVKGFGSYKVFSPSRMVKMN